MIPMPYSWLSPTDRDLTGCEEVFAAIDRKDWTPGKKDLYATYYLTQRDRYREENRLKDFSLSPADIKSWRRQSAFKKCLADYEEQETDKFRISGMVTTICMTLVLFFAKAMWEGEYFINFSVDAIVGVIALVLAISQYRIKYRVIGMFVRKRDFIYMDVLSIVLCLLLKIWLPASMDFSLFVLLMNYFFQKKRFEQAMKTFAREN